MPATTKAPAAKTARKPAGSASKASGPRKASGANALDGLQVSLDDAQKAIAELRRDLSAGGRRLVKDVEAGVKKARRDLARTRKAIKSDLGELGGALTSRRTAKPAARKPAATKPAARKPAAKKPVAKAKPRAAGRARSS